MNSTPNASHIGCEEAPVMGLNCAVYNSCGFSHGMGEGKNTQQLSGPKNPAKVNKEVLVWGGEGGVSSCYYLAARLQQLAIAATNNCLVNGQFNDSCSLNSMAAQSNYHYSRDPKSRANCQAPKQAQTFRFPRRPFAEQKIARQQLLLPPCLIRRNSPARVHGGLKAHARTHRISREYRNLKPGLAEGLTTQ
jgi:hypothetical protein